MISRTHKVFVPSQYVNLLRSSTPLALRYRLLPRLCSIRDPTPQELEYDENDPNNPDLDNIVIDEQYYKDIGYSQEDIENDRIINEFDYMDPEATEPTLDDLYAISDDIPQSYRRYLQEQESYGEPGVYLAGFRLEELCMVRTILDSASAYDVKVILVQHQMLGERLEVVLQTPEVDWSAPRPKDWIGGSLGSPRTVLFAGLTIPQEATIVELLEEGGLPPLCVCRALQEDMLRPFGDILAEAVKVGRLRDKSEGQVWETEEGRTVKGITLPELQQIVKDEFKDRLDEVQMAVKKGDIQSVLRGKPQGEEITLDLNHLSEEEIQEIYELQRQEMLDKSGHQEQQEEEGEDDSEDKMSNDENNMQQQQQQQKQQQNEDDNQSIVDSQQNDSLSQEIGNMESNREQIDPEIIPPQSQFSQNQDSQVEQKSDGTQQQGLNVEESNKQDQKRSQTSSVSLNFDQSKQQIQQKEQESQREAIEQQIYQQQQQQQEFEPIEIKNDLDDILDVYESGVDIKPVYADDPLALDQIIDTYEEGSQVFLKQGYQHDNQVQQSDQMSSSQQKQQEQVERVDQPLENVEETPEEAEEASEDVKFESGDELELSEEERQFRWALKEYEKYQEEQNEETSKDEQEILKFMSKAIRKGWGEEKLTELVHRAVTDMVEEDEKEDREEDYDDQKDKSKQQEKILSEEDEEEQIRYYRDFEAEEEQQKQQVVSVDRHDGDIDGIDEEILSQEGEIGQDQIDKYGSQLGQTMSIPLR